jgi:hypothetical protein
MNFKPLLKGEIVLLLGVSLAWTSYAVHHLTLHLAAQELVESRQRLDQAGSEISGLTERLERSESARVVAEQEAAVVRGANRLLREEEFNQQSEITRLRSDLEFYRGLTGSGGAQSGLAIYTADLDPTDSPLVFRFTITLTNNIRRAAIVNGRVLIDLEGTLDDRPVTLYWSQLTDGNKPQPTFRFKYFQEIEGYLALPANFRPTQLLVTLEADRQRKPIRRQFDWHELVAPEDRLIGGAPTENAGS